MSSRYTIAAVIRTYQDPHLMLAAAAYVPWVDEIIIADNSDNSSIKDASVLIQHPNVKYLYSEHVDFRPRINSMKDKIESDFILMIDTDEFYYKEAEQEILGILADKENIKEGYIVPSESYVFGSHLGKGADQLRMVMTDKFYFEFKSVHEMAKVPGPVGKLKYGYKHYNSPTFASQQPKPFKYAMEDARVMKEEELNAKRVDNFSSFQIKKHFFMIMARIMWRSKGFFLTRNVSFVNLWLRYVDVLVITSNDIAPTEEIRIREGKAKDHL